MALRPFPPGGGGLALRKLVALLLWLAWAALLASLVLPVLVGEPRISLLATLQGAIGGDDAAWRRAAAAVWPLPPALHVALVWGPALLSQRAGYADSFVQCLAARFGGVGCAGGGPRSAGLRAALAAAARAGAHAAAAADPAIDALFFPARALAMDARRSAANAGVWAAVIAAKVAFEYCLVIYPLVSMAHEVCALGAPSAARALAADGLSMRARP